MTDNKTIITNIERQFFETFGIKPEYKTCIFKYCKNKKEYDCENCNDREWYYPEITSDILLELICILSKYQKDRGLLLEIYEISLNELKEEILEMIIFHNKDLNYQVKSLFKEIN